MGQRIKCFMLTPTNDYVVTLRRYSREGQKCTGPYGYHDADVRIDVVKWDGKFGRSEDSLKSLLVSWGIGLDPVKSPCAQYPGVTSYDDPRWPKKCEYCAYEFVQADNWQLYLSLLLSRSDGGPAVSLREAPPGAMYYTPWVESWPSHWKGPDGRVLTVKTPGGEWNIDSRASNCTRKDDNTHRCWVRHGIPPEITVDKNGDTCNAGGGSIMAGNYHGFLRNGYLED